jgi:hypothetical protein
MLDFGGGGNFLANLERLHPRHVVPKPTQAYEPEGLIVSTSCGPKGVYPPAPRSLA